MRHRLWAASLATSPACTDLYARIFDGALAITVLAPPRRRQTRIEALYREKPDHAALTAKLAVMAMLHKTRAPKLRIAETPKLDWLKKVAGDFPPLPVARWTVHGAGHRAAVPGRKQALQIDATSAFGTGEHPTTRGCLLMLDWLLNREQPRLTADIGCGSGILAMAYAKATHGHAVAVDLDPVAVEIARGNIRVNGLQRHIRIGLGRGYRAALVRKNAPYDLVMANIFAGPLCEMAKDLKRHLRPGGHAILSGLLNAQANRVLAAHRLQGLALVKRMRIGEWTILCLRKPGRR